MRIEARDWKTFAEQFSRTHDGWSASLEVRMPDGTTEMAIDDRPFRGVCFENRGGHDALLLVFGDDADEHLAHIVDHPRELAATGDTLVVGEQDGSGCVLELACPFAEE